MKVTHQKTNVDELFQTYLEYLFLDTTSQVQYTYEQKLMYQKHAVCPIYGELLFPSLKKVLASLPLTEDDVFLDMGSGLGKLAILAFYLGPMRQVRGIEASLHLYEQSIKPLADLKRECSELFKGLRHLSLEYGNFLQANLSDVTVAYCCSSCFSQNLIYDLGYKINATPNIRHVLSLRPIPTLTRLKFIKVIEVECSWDSALCYQYSKN